MKLSFVGADLGEDVKKGGSSPAPNILLFCWSRRADDSSLFTVDFLMFALAEPVPTPPLLVDCPRNDETHRIALETQDLTRQCSDGAKRGEAWKAMRPSKARWRH